VVGNPAIRQRRFAFSIAVQQVVGTIVDTETIVREDDAIREQILSASNGFIKSYNVIRQWQMDSLHQCSISALVEVRQLKERLSEANISTSSLSGANLAARVQTETAGKADTAAILAKLINDLPNRVLRVQAHGDPVPISSKQEGVTRLKIPIIVFVDQKAYAQELAELTTTLDKMALERVTGNLKLKRDAWQRKGTVSHTSGAADIVRRSTPVERRVLCKRRPWRGTSCRGSN
jgi:hypothetical protein